MLLELKKKLKTKQSIYCTDPVKPSLPQPALNVFRTVTINCDQENLLTQKPLHNSALALFYYTQNTVRN